MPKVATCLWFDDRAEEAADFYASTFRVCGQDASLGEAMRHGPSGPRPEGSVMTVEFTLAGQRLVALNGGPHFTFSPAVSLVVECADQAEVDRFWEALSKGGEPGRCGWLKDRFGLSWQVVPTVLCEMLRDSDPARVGRVMQALLRMAKLDVGALKRAFGGAPD